MMQLIINFIAGGIERGICGFTVLFYNYMYVIAVLFKSYSFDLKWRSNLIVEEAEVGGLPRNLQLTLNSILWGHFF